MSYIRNDKFIRSTKAFGAYLVNRAHGKKYGKAVINGTKVRIVPTEELVKFRKDIEQYGFPLNGGMCDMSKSKYSELLRRIAPIIKSDKKTIVSSDLCYSALGDRVQIYDAKNMQQKLFIIEEASHPTRDFLRYIMHPIGKQIKKIL